MFLFLLLAFFLLAQPVSARNIFGLHLTNPSDLSTAAPIINSSGGNWGWATIVIRSDQLDFQTWQNFFNDCRRLHIIPILRLATAINQNQWAIPTVKSINQTVKFLNTLNWPTQKQHVILFNEVNHANEWGGAVNLTQFAQLATYTCQTLKSTNPNFYVLGSPPDLAAPSKPPQHESAANFYLQIKKNSPEYFNCIDAIASHSYPNHGFIGLPTDSGPTSVYGYQWELSFLKSIGIQNTYPVFITETGWPHRQGQQPNNSFYTLNTAVNFLQTALQNWEQNPQIQAVTPFIYNYPFPPFDHFSWLDENQKLYPQYQQIINLAKNSNQPAQITKFSPTKFHIPLILFPNQEYFGQISLTNKGQSIWGRGETTFCLAPQTTPNIKLTAICTPSDYVQPGQSATFNFKFSIQPTQQHSGKSYISWQNLPPFEITPLTNNSRIYRPKTGLKNRILTFFQKISIWH